MGFFKDTVSKSSVCAKDVSGPDAIPWIKTSNVHRASNKFKTGFSTMSKAQRHCLSIGANCKSVYDSSCDGSGPFYVCKVGTYKPSGQGSCVYAPNIASCSCTPHTKCPPGKFTKKAGTATSQPVCETSATTTAPKTTKKTPVTKSPFVLVGFNAECAGSNALSVFTVKSIMQCEDKCKDNNKCLSLTWYPSGTCVLFSTPCSSTKFNQGAISLRYVGRSAPVTTTTAARPITTPARTTAKKTPMTTAPAQTTTGTKYPFTLVNINAECVGNAFFVTKLKSITECEDKCKDNNKCLSLTSYSFSNVVPPGTCMLFSTPCSSSKYARGAISLRHVARAAAVTTTTAARPITTKAPVTTTTARPTTTPARTKTTKKTPMTTAPAQTTTTRTTYPFNLVGINAECDRNNEVTLFGYYNQTSRDCEQKCKDNKNCQSLTWYGPKGDCVLFRTPCHHINYKKGAVSLRYVAARPATKPAPVTTKAPKTTKPAPVTTKQAPKTTTKAAPPTTKKPAPVTTKKAPVTTKAAPKTTKPAPVTTKPAPKTTKATVTFDLIGTNAECDTKNGEVYLKDSPGRVQSIGVCQQACRGNKQCKSITFFKSGWCSLYSTPCTKIKKKKGAIAMRVATPTTKAATTTAKPKPVATTKGAGKWVDIGNNIECDTGRGEQYMRSSPRKVSSFNKCKKSCEDSNTGCESVTYFRSSGWCSHFSTPCGKFKKKKNAVSSRFQSAQGSQSAQAKKPKWVDLGSNKACNTDDGEEYMDNSPGKLKDRTDCQQACEADEKCKSISYFGSGWCSLYSTECTKTIRKNRAVSMRLV